MKTNLFKSINLIRRGSGASLNLFRYAAMVFVLLTLGIGNAWAGGGSNNTYYSKMNVTITSGQTGYGTVYVTSSGKTSDTKNSSASSAPTHTYNIYATANAGYKFTSWSGSGITFGSTTTANTTGAFSASSTNSGSPTEKTATASFSVVQVTAAPADVTINATDPSATYPDAAGVVVGFTTSSSNANSDFTTGGSGDSRWTISAWPTHASATSTTFNYKFVGNGSYGTTNRTFTKTVTLKGLNDATVKTCTLTAKYPNPRVVECNEGSTDLTIYPTFSAADATQAAVEKTAVFDVVYADNANNFTAAFSGATGSGVWSVSSISVDQANQKATVTYTFNGNKSVGTHTAVLTLTANDCNGWDDTSAAGGASATVTLTAENTQEATDDAKVIASDGETLIYQGDWVTALGKANTAANAGCTLQLLRNVHLNDLGLTSTQGITNTFTLDLNGKILSGEINGSVLNPKTSGKTLTIKDSKTGGRIQNITPDYDGITYGVNISAGTVNLESGTIYAENQKQYNYGTSSVGGTASNTAAVEVRAVRLVAGAKFNMSGGKVEAHGTRAVRAIYQESSKANTTEVNISGGEVYAEAPSYVYGILAYGKVNISGTAQINVKINDGLVNGNATYQSSKFDSYTLHRYGYAIYMTASANKTPSACYFGTLTMTGGTINVENVNKTLNGTSLNTEHTYGIYMNIASTGMGNANGEATDGTNTQKASSIGSIENATINVTHAGVQVYGVYVLGCYNSFNNTTTPFSIKNSTINVTGWQTVYGALADVSIDWSNSLTTYTGTGRCSAGNIELTNTTINATTTGGTGAYCAWASATYGTVADAKANTGARSTGNATYKGEYAVAATLTVNSGTYTASAATSSAYAVGSSDRAITIRNIRGSISNRDAVEDPVGSLGGNAEAYPELNIHGGNFSATTGTTTAIAVKSGGNTLIDGGTFNAYAGGSTAYGLYVTAGKTVANGVTFPASATTKAYGVYVTGGISDWSLFTYYGDVELNNCNATATARTTTDARGVFAEGNTKVYTQASFDAMKSANNSNYQNYGDYAQVGERAFVAKVTINGGTYSATAETTTAYGIVMTSTRVSTNKEAIAYNPLVVRNATVTAKTNTGTTAYGVQIGGGGLVENCTISATAGTTTASGVRAIDKTTVIKNSTISAKGTDAVYGLEGYVEASTAHGYCWHGDFDLSEAGTTKVTAESTGATKAYTIYLNAKAVNVASGAFAGDYATAANATINGGTYIAKTNGGTSGYTLALTGTQTKGTASAQPEVLIEGGKFNGATAEVGTAGVAGHVQLKGGYYVHNTNLSKYIPEGYEEFPLPSERPEYTEGYRYAVEPVGMHGIDVCQIGSTKYKSLEEALQVVTSGQVIYMIANYTMATPGDYVLPSGATLLIPYKDGTGKGASTAIGNSAVTNSSATTPSLFRKLTFGNGVNLTCFGTIETSAQQKCNGQYGACAGMVSGAYGQIHLEEGSHISLEANSRLNCWGYITGKGTINVKKNATVLEDFQLGDWPGGSNASTLNNNSDKVFPITHYFYQNIECPITYRPGSSALGSSHIYASSTVVGQDAVKLVGTSGALFLMADNDESADTWVMKDYDETTDRCVWTMNSGATIGNLNINLDAGWISYNFTSANYDLPITTNMTIILNNGEMGLSQNTVFLPGSKLIVNKQGTFAINGVNVVAYDASDWTGTTIYRATYSPTWGTTNPRSTTAIDAEFFLHGKVNIKGNGGLYTTTSGANVHSTNEDAGEVIYTTAAQGNKTTKYLKQGGTTRASLTANPAKLKNTDGSYASSAGTTSGKTWTFKNDIWDAWSKDGCFFMNAQDEPHAKPAALVQLTSKTPDANHLHHDAATGTRNFVWDENCYWWEVSTTPTAEGYYLSLNADNNGDYNYYYYDNAAACWKIKKITITWNINGTTTNYSVGYGTKPEWLGATPTKTSSSSNYVWRWDGWTKGSDPTVLANNDLPYVTENTTFTAHFYEKYYEYNITFKNSDGTILDSRNWRAGTTPSYEGTPTKNATVDYTYEFNGSWSPAITKVTGSATYTAQYTATPRAYTITFLNYDMSKLGTAEVVYNNTPSNATYLAAVAPKTEDPYKPDNSAYSFEFAGWRLQGASSNGFAQVKGDQTYIAQFNQTTKKYKISFVDEDGETVLHYLQLEYGQTPSYTWDNPANKQDVEWTYSFATWDPAEFATVEGPQTYTAVYNKTARKYDITWKDGDGNTLKTDQVAYGETPAYSGETPTKTSTNTHNYTFNNTWSPAIVDVEGEATYTAQFNETERTYRVTWDANGGTCATAYNDFSYNAAIGTLPIASKTGHDFNGWFTSTTGGTQITTATKVTADVIYHAHFTASNYAVTLHTNSGTINAGNVTSYTYGVGATLPTNVTRTGYDFGGWYDNSGLTGSAVTAISTTATGDKTYWAKWTEASYAVTLNTNSGTINAGNVTSYTYGTGATLPTNVTRTGYDFGGWYDNSGLTGSAVTVISTTATGNKEYWAKWTASNYTVTLNTNSGTINAGNVTGYTYGVGATLPTNVTRTGYDFGGWYDNSGLTGSAVTAISTTATSNKEYWAKWTASNYTVTLNTNSGTINAGNVTGYTYGVGATLPTNVTRTGYDFGGWYDNSGLTGSAVTAISTTATGDKTYWAKWTPKSYTITFDSNGGSAVASITQNYGTAVTAPAAPTREGYTFNGWSPAVPSTMPVNGLTCVAQWTVNPYTITFNSNGGSSVASITQNYGTAVTAPADPTREGYTFNGWSPAVPSTMPVNGLTCVAQWTVNPYTITFNSNGGSAVESITQNYGTSVTAPADPTREGYTFNGWSPTVPSTMPVNGLTCVAQWTVNPYTITFNSNGGSAVESITQDYGTTVTAPADPSREGYTFNGWSPAVPSTMPVNGLTCVAQWTINQYTLTLEANHAEWGTVDGGGLYDYNSAHIITATPKTGFKFVKWNDDNTNASREVTVTADVTYTATFDYDIANYTVKHWQQNIDNDEYTEVVADRQTNLSGTIGTLTNAVAKSYTGFDALLFDQDTIAVSGTEVNIRYNRKTYLIKWDVKLNGNTEAHKEETLRYGATPSYGADPTKEQSDREVYTFSGWTPNPYAVDKAQTYKGSFIVSPRPYTITFVNDNNTTVLQSSDFGWGSTPGYSGTPESTVDAAYEFIGWTPAIAAVTGETTYVATYKRTVAPIEVTNGNTEPVSMDTETTKTTIHEGGTLEVASGKTLTTDILILEASDSNSGQITGAGNVEVTASTGKAYFDLKLNTPARHWHAFGVPWAVDINTNPLVEVDEEGKVVRTLTLGNQYEIVYYDTHTRATEGPGSNCWKYLKHYDQAGQPIDELTPGKGYMIAFTCSVQTVRFVKKEGAPVLYNGEVTVSAEGEGTNKGINAVANPMAYHAKMTLAGVGQVHDGGEIGSDGYEPVTIDEMNYIVGKTVYVQVDEEQTLTPTNGISHAVAAAPVRRAPKATDKKYLTLEDYYSVSLTNANGIGTKLYVLPEEDKEDKYVIGHDLVKMGMSTKKPQIWINRYGVNLALNTVAPVNETAEFPVKLYAPTAGEYTINNIQPSAVSDQNDYIVYLTQNGEAIWNLSDAPYALSLPAGTNKTYGLRLTVRTSPTIATGVDEAVVDAKNEIRKVLVNDKVFIIRGNNVYSIDGQLVK